MVDDPGDLISAADAQRLRDDPAFQRAILKYEEHITKRWKHSQPEESDVREDCYRQLQALKGVLVELKVASDKGIMTKRRAQENHERTRPAGRSTV